MKFSRGILIYGGSFDPPHNGHINCLINTQKIFGFDEVRFLPCKTPVLKEKTQASPQNRIEMLKFAIAPFGDGFTIDDREICRETPSYMVDTLTSIRQEVPANTPIILLIGYDSLITLPLWYEWHKLIRLCHLLVVNRPNYQKELLSPQVKTLLKNHQSHCTSDLHKTPYGKIFLFDAGYYDISSSKIREKIKNHLPVDKYLSADILNYIEKHYLYQ